MYTQTLYELSQEAERLFSFPDNSCSYWKKYLSLYPERCATTGFTLESA